ncbi:MAG: hypothetical protein KDI16_04805 [Halioglobus sp.]|nr:hypothetical protein [Halioglobus sp.]
MLKIAASGILLLANAWSLAGPGADTVNERIPVSKDQLEAHWELDCAGARADLQRTLAAERADCGVAEPLRRALRLCAFVHQPPGREPAPRCPDFDRLSGLLEQRRCSAVGDLLQQRGNCTAGTPP